MVHRGVDPLTGAGRDHVLISGQDADRLGLASGERVRLRSPTGSLVARIRLDRIKPGNLEVHWPEGNVLLSAEEIDIVSREPDYNARVRLERL
jgi:anaerobic selenocysteine-containing dehydrogenase